MGAAFWDFDEPGCLYDTAESATEEYDHGPHARRSDGPENGIECPRDSVGRTKGDPTFLAAPAALRLSREA
jgi:hypothetical protein